MLTVNNSNDQYFFDNLVHNRLNFRWFINNNFTFRVEMRNRIYNGELVSLYPNYDDLIDSQNDYFDLSTIPYSTNEIGIHLMLDRLSLRWVHVDWEITLGRQRVNWGQNLVWNPNDIFNAYSFFDFDYEERPGADALRIVRYLGFASKLEFAIKAAHNMDELTSAFLYKFNYKEYDIQLITGVMQGDYTFGLGWSGNLMNAGFKGELSYFKDFELNNGDISSSISFDYSFENSLYLHISGLYNGFGSTDLNTENLLLNTQTRLSAKNLLPFKYAGLAQTSYQFHPLVNGGIAVMFFPGQESLFINPNIGYSITQNFDLDAIAQIIYLGDGMSLQSSFFIRGKWSF